METLLRLRGRQEELAARVSEFQDLAARFPSLPALRAALGCVYADLGRDTAALAEFQRLAAHDVEALPRNTTWLATLSLVAELCAFIDDGEYAARVYQLLKPYAGHDVVFDAAVVSLGSVSRYLGILASVMGSHDLAVQHFEQALERNARTGARPYLAYTEFEYAQMLQVRGATGDQERSSSLLQRALGSARDLGMEGLEARMGRPSITETTPDPVAAAAAATAALRQEGDYWSIVYGGDRFQLHDVKGLHYLSRLLANPGHEFHVLDLIAEGGGRPAAGGPPRRTDGEVGEVSSGHAGPVLDAQAKAAYRRRVEDLREEIDDADAANDPERAAKARAELDFLTRELAAAVGLGGRDRKAASEAERARVNITRTIKGALDRIRGESPSLYEHLAISVHTGTYCSYHPDPRAAVNWQL